jgi:phthiodiolone/phenolphthiodiolone dimycocerosates ketoreductase
MRLDSLWAIDHWLDFPPMGIWDEDFSWAAKAVSSPHEFFGWAPLLGWAAGRAGKIQLAVGVTDPIRHHPVKLAQDALTLAHLARQPPILGIGAGEAENLIPYGINFDTPVARLEEALQIIRICFDSSGPFDFNGKHFQLNGAMMDLGLPPDRTPEIWVAAHGPRMLRLTGRYGDGWYRAIPMTPTSTPPTWRPSERPPPRPDVTRWLSPPGSPCSTPLPRQRPKPSSCLTARRCASLHC